MTKQAKSPPPGKGTNSSIPSFGPSVFNGEMAESYVRAGQAFFENAISMNQEIMRFASERIQKDVAALQAISGCANWQDAVALQSGFLQSTTAEYQAEMKKLWEQGTQATSRAGGLFGEAGPTAPEAKSGTGQE